MACLLIASQSFCDGEEIAAEVAHSLGHAPLGEELLRETAERHSASQQQLLRAVTTPPSLFGMPVARRSRCLAYLKATLIEHIAGELVYCGPGAHLLAPAIPHVIRIAIGGDPQQRAARRARTRGEPLAHAAKAIAAEDRELERCAEQVFGVHGDDESRCDLRVDVDRDGRGGAVDAIQATAASPRFQATSYSTRCVQDALLCARASALLVGRDPHVQVTADGGELDVRLRLRAGGRERSLSAIREELAELPGLANLKIDPLSEDSGDRSGR